MNASLIEHFEGLKDPGIERHKKHQLVDIIVLSICAVLSGAEGWEAIEEYGHTKLVLRRMGWPTIPQSVLGGGLPADRLSFNHSTPSLPYALLTLFLRDRPTDARR